jgi:hypothetical protein
VITSIIAIVLAMAWTAFVTETIIESARASGGLIMFLERTLLTPGIRPSTLILCGLAASAGLACAAAVAYARGRRLRRRSAAALDAREEEVKVQAAGDAARAGLLEWRIAELRTSMEDLTKRRDQVVAEMDLARRRTSELRALSEDYKRSLTKLQDRVVTVPDVDDELAERRTQRETADPTR